MAYPEKRPGGWRVRWLLPEKGPNGEARYGSESGFPTKQAALDYGEDQEAAIRAGTWINPEHGKIHLDDYWAEWIAVQRLSDSTRDRYDSYYRNHLHPYWGDDPIADITTLGVDGFKKMLLETKRLKPGTVNPIVELLGRMLADAAFEHRIGFSPVRPRDRRGERTGPADKRVGIAITLEQLLAICARIPAPEALLVLATAFTGMRWGEAAGMRRSFLRLEADRGTYTIDRKIGALKERKGILSFGPPKDREERTIELPAFLVALLLAYLATIPAERDLLFPCGSGEGYRRGNFGRQLWRPACDGWPARGTSKGHAAVQGAPPIVATLRFHDLRHTHETWMTEDHIEKIARDGRLGHDTPGMEGTYNHVTDKMRRQVLDVLEARWATAKGRVLPHGWS